MTQVLSAVCGGTYEWLSDVYSGNESRELEMGESEFMCLQGSSEAMPTKAQSPIWSLAATPADDQRAANPRPSDESPAVHALVIRSIWGTSGVLPSPSRSKTKDLIR